MVCYHPLKAYRRPGGGVAFNSVEGYADRPLELPCGQCTGWKKEGANETYVSQNLEDLWGLGFCTVGHLTWQSAAYVARYVLKKATGPAAEEKYRRIDITTGEETFVKPPYVTMSLKPGLGKEWFEKFQSDVYPSDEVVHDGKKHRPPRYYDKLLEKEDAQKIESMKTKRREAAYKRRENTTPERLAIREEVNEARLSHLKRQV